MAKRILLLDDLTQEEGAEAVTFTIADDVYELDLTGASLDGLYKAVAKYTKVARHRVRGGNGTNGETQAIRAWAASNGYEVGTKGRVPQEVVDAYNAAQQQPQG
jgi:hypothetical protein